MEKGISNKTILIALLALILGALIALLGVNLFWNNPAASSVVSPMMSQCMGMMGKDGMQGMMGPGGMMDGNAMSGMMGKGGMGGMMSGDMMGQCMGMMKDPKMAEQCMEMCGGMMGKDGMQGMMGSGKDGAGSGSGMMDSNSTGGMMG